MASQSDPIQSYLSARLDDASFPGAVWHVSDARGVASAGAVGDACRLPRAETATVDTAYDLASLTKPLSTALLAVQLEQDGRLDLEDAASRLLPELEGSPYAASTLLDLGVHRAGLPAGCRIFLSASTRGEYLERIAAQAPVAAGGSPVYSDLSYILLGIAIERAANDDLDHLFASCIAAPLGLLSTGYARNGGGHFARAAATEAGSNHERRRAGVAGERYPWRTAVIRGDVHDGNAYGLGGVAGNAGLFGTAAEVAAIAREMLAPSLLPLGAAARRRLLTPVAGSGGRTFGFGLARDVAAARDVLPDDAPGHTGFTGCSLWLDAAEGKKVYVLLTNRIHPDVTGTDFAPVRREFHRLAASAFEPTGGRR